MSVGSQVIDTEELADRVYNRKRKGHPHFGKGFFYPAGIYNNPAVLDAAVVRALLGLDPDEDEPLVKFALTRAPKIFLTLVCLSWTAKEVLCFTRHFMETGFDDENLPVGRRFCDSAPAFSLSDWSRARKNNFCERQWEHLAPVFSKENFVHRLDEDQPLPFLKPGHGTPRSPEGASSVVYQVEVHEDHLLNPPQNVSTQICTVTP